MLLGHPASHREGRRGAGNPPQAVSAFTAGWQSVTQGLNRSRSKAGCSCCCSSPLRADSGKNLARLHAEQAWQALHQQQGLPLHIFRLGGASLL